MKTARTSVLRRLAALTLGLVANVRRIKLVRAGSRRVPVRWKTGLRRFLLRSAAGALPATRYLAAASEAAPGRRRLPDDAGHGVNLIGSVRGEFGLGQSVRLCARTLEEAGYPFSLVDFSVSMPGRVGDTSLESWLDPMADRPTNVCFVNPDRMRLARDHFGPAVFDGRYTAGYWFWELERLPRDWHDAFDLVDEVWVASTFVQRAVAAATRKPVFRMPLAVELPPVRPDRHRFGLPPDCFVFLFSFDFHSYPARKNPRAVIAAFREAFPRSRQDVRLVIKTINGDRLVEAYEQLVIDAAGDSRIAILDMHLSPTDTLTLLASADAYVSLHRAEGLGLGLAEAMGMGKPVVATAYSGNMDFMSSEEACLVDYHLVDIEPGAYPHWQGQQWAEPDLAAAARHLRRLADDASFAARLGHAARGRIRQQYSRRASAEAMIGRLEAISRR